MIKLKLVLNEDLSLIKEQAEAWPGDKKKVEDFLKTFKDVKIELVGLYNTYKIKPTGIKDAKSIKFYQDGTYFISLSPPLKPKKASYKFENGKFTLYKGSSIEANKIDGYVLNKNGIGVFEPVEVQQAAEKEKEKSLGVLDKLSSKLGSDEMLDTITGVLDITGFIEIYGIGAISDLIAMLIHISRERWLDAALSAFGVIPFASAAVVPIKMFIRSNKKAAEMIKKIGQLSTPAEKRAAVDFWSYLHDSGTISTESMEKIATGFKSVSNWISKNGPKPDNSQIYSAFRRTVDFFDEAGATIKQAQNATRAAQLMSRSNIISKIAKGIWKPIDTLKLLSKEPAVFGQKILKTVNATGFAESSLKAMRINLRNRFIRNMITDPQKIRAVIITSIERRSAFNTLLTRVANTNNPRLQALVKRSRTNPAEFENEFIDVMKNSSGKVKEQLSDIFSNWMIETKNPYYISFIDNTANQLKTLAGATNMGLGDFWRTFKANFWNMDNMVNLLGSELATLYYTKNNLLGDEDRLMAGDAIVGPIVAGWAKSALKNENPTGESVAQDVKDMIYLPSELEQSDTTRIPTK